MILQYLALFLIVVMVAFLYSKWRHSYWSLLGVPTAPHLPFIGNIHQGLFTPVWMLYDQMYKKHSSSKLWGIYEGFNPVLVISDPDTLREVLVKHFDHFVDRRFFGSQSDEMMREMVTNKTGDEWKMLRSVLTPTFTSGKMKIMFPLLCDKADLLVNSCLKDSITNPIIDMKDKAGRYTMDTIASCAFGIECNSFAKDKPEFAQHADEFFSLSLKKGLQFILSFMFPKIASAVGIKLFASEIEFFSQVAKTTIKSREHGPRRGDFLDLMLEARTETHGSDNKISPKHVLSDKAIVAQSAGFLIGGYDTTASTLAFASHLLAQHPIEQQRLREELQEIVKQEGQLTYQGIMDAKFLYACIQETLRLYPPATVVERMCTKTYTLSGTKVKIRAGDIIQFPIWSIQRDSRYWQQPQKFIPDRFTQQNKENIRHYTHMPFGMGPRKCLAMRFALLEIQVALAKLVLSAEIQVAKGHEDIAIDKASFMLRPMRGSKLQIIPLAGKCP